jgi:hypothetical protein
LLQAAAVVVLVGLHLMRQAVAVQAAFAPRQEQAVVGLQQKENYP